MQTSSPLSGWQASHASITFTSQGTSEKRFFDQFRATMDGPSREQIMLQLFTMRQQESAQLQFMLDISSSISKAYADFVSNFISTLINLVLIRRNAYLRHAHPSLDVFRIPNLRAAQSQMVTSFREVSCKSMSSI